MKLTDDELLALARKIIAADREHCTGWNRCPCCGYDGIWPDSDNEAEERVLEMLKRAMEGEG